MRGQWCAKVVGAVSRAHCLKGSTYYRLCVSIATCFLQLLKFTADILYTMTNYILLSTTLYVLMQCQYRICYGWPTCYHRVDRRPKIILVPGSIEVLKKHCTRLFAFQSDAISPLIERYKKLYQAASFKFVLTFIVRRSGLLHCRVYKG